MGSESSGWLPTLIKRYVIRLRYRFYWQERVVKRSSAVLRLLAKTSHWRQTASQLAEPIKTTLVDHSTTQAFLIHP